MRLLEKFEAGFSTWADRLKCESGPFAQDTSGPATPTGLNPNKRALVLDHDSAIVEVVGDAGVAQGLQTCLLSLLAQTALTTITTAQNLINKTLNKGVLNKQGRILAISGQVIFTNPAGTPQITIALVLGGVTLCTIQTAATGSGATNMPLNFAFEISTVATGASGTLEVHGQVNAQLTTAISAAIAGYIDGNSAVSSALNLGTALALQVTIAASSTVTSAQLRQAQIELIN